MRTNEMNIEIASEILRHSNVQAFFVATFCAVLIFLRKVAILEQCLKNVKIGTA